MPALWVAFDIEGGGPRLTDPVIAIGVCYGTVKWYRKKTWQIQTDFNSIEDKCREEFWDQHPGLFQALQTRAEPASVVWSKINQFLFELEQTFPHDVIHIVSDNPDYDLGKMNFYLHQHCQRLPVRYSSQGKYRFVSDPDSYLKFFPEKDQLKALVRSRAAHTHYPADDAECLFLKAILVEDPRKLVTQKLPTLMVESEPEPEHETKL